MNVLIESTNFSSNRMISPSNIQHPYMMCFVVITSITVVCGTYTFGVYFCSSWDEMVGWGVCNLDEQLVSLFVDLGWDELVRVIVSLLRLRSILMCYSNLLLQTFIASMLLCSLSCASLSLPFLSVTDM